MAMTLPSDFKEFLKLLNSHRVEYLLIGGYAVAYYGYPRATADMDLWVAISPANAERAANALREFGFDVPELTPQTLLATNKIVRMGAPPLRIELMTTISGVTFAECYKARTAATIDGVEVPLISLDDLKANKRASARFKDLDDLENLQ